MPRNRSDLIVEVSGDESLVPLGRILDIHDDGSLSIEAAICGNMPKQSTTHWTSALVQGHRHEYYRPGSKIPAGRCEILAVLNSHAALLEAAKAAKGKADWLMNRNPTVTLEEIRDTLSAAIELAEGK